MSFRNLLQISTLSRTHSYLFSTYKTLRCSKLWPRNNRSDVFNTQKLTTFVYHRLISSDQPTTGDMATSLLLKRTTTAANLFNKLYVPIQSVSAAPSVHRNFNTDSAQVSAYEDFNRSVDQNRSPDSSVSRRRDNDFFSDMFDPISPTRSLSQIFNMMDRFMENPFMTTSQGGLGLGARRGWDVKENDESLSLRFDMPGLDKENVKISVEHNTLIIKAEAEKEAEDDGEPPRRYSSRIDLPVDTYKLDEIKAEMKNGVLKIMVPKVKAEERKNVWEVQVK